MSARFTPAAIVLTLAVAASAAAQTPGQPSLVDVAKRTEATRADATTKKAQKTYTNKDLRAVPAPEPEMTAPDAKAADKNASAAQPQSNEQAGDKLSAEEEAKLNVVPEEMWRARAGRIREQAAAGAETLRQIRARPRSPNPARQEQNDKEEARMVNAMNALKKQWASLEAQARDQKINLAWLEPLPAFPQ